MKKLFPAKILNFSLSLLPAVTTLILAGCGGHAGSDGKGNIAASGVAATGAVSVPVQTITGTVATGNPLAATITIKDSTAGAPKIATGSSSPASGMFSIPVTGMTPPFMLVAVPASGKNLYSVLPVMNMTTSGTKNVNITPVTTLVMYELNGGQDPASMYSVGTYSSVTDISVATGQINVRSKIPNNNVNPIFDMMYGNFYPTGVSDSTGYDTALDYLGKIIAISSANVSFSNGFTYTPSSGGLTSGTNSISLAMTNPSSGAATTSFTSSSPVRVTATVKDATGAAVANALVTFSTSRPVDSNHSCGATGGYILPGGATFAFCYTTETFSSGGTALTDLNGVASLTLTTSSSSGKAATITAISNVSGKPVTGTLNYSVVAP